MHATIAELLSLRDGEPVAVDVRGHVECCEPCLEQLEHLRAVRAGLQALPLVPPASDRWAGIAAAADAVSPNRHKPARWHLWAPGLAAAMAIAVGAAWLTMSGSQSLPTAQQTQIATAAPSTPPADIAALRRQSSQLEMTLRALRRRDAMMSVRAANTIANLEDGVAAIDYRLNQGALQGMSPAQAERLWRQRVGLMRSLVTVRYVQASARE
ncbi:MAG TPA: hypothetical protein VFK96_04215 [Gammaproteobacteria bacterium]|nr:hypothetical protein [Gammaproteobacteria bacterium]